MKLEQPEPETIGDEAAETEVYREFLARNRSSSITRRDVMAAQE